MLLIFSVNIHGLFTGYSIYRYENSKKKSLIFKGNCLKQKNATYTPPNRIIVYELDTWLRDLNSDFNLKDCLYGSVKLAKNTDPDKFVYSGYDTGFDSRSEFSLPDGSMGKTVIIFRVNKRSSVHIGNKKKYILIIGFGPTQGLYDTTLTAEV